MKVAMIGLGKLGMPCGEAMAQKHEVMGYDVSPVESKSIQVKSSIKEAIDGTEIIFIAVPTPHDEKYDGRSQISDLPPKDFDYAIVKEVLGEITQHANKDQDIVLISTVLPGTVRREFAQIVDGFTFIYNPYFIAMGTVAEDFMAPEFFILGERDGDTKKMERVINFYNTVVPNLNTRLGTWEEAECVKIFYNTFISFKLSFVNMIQDVSMSIGHINVDFVTDSLCLGNKRILSPMYMKAGMGDGGPCHPRDNIALRDLAARLDLGYDLYSSIMESREAQAKNLARYLLKFNKPIVILGKSFKPGVPFTDGSYSLLIGHYIEKQGGSVNYWDFLIDDCKFETKEAGTYLLGHMDDRFHSHSFAKGSTIIDPWRRCPDIEGCEVIHYGDTRQVNPDQLM